MLITLETRQLETAPSEVFTQNSEQKDPEIRLLNPDLWSNLTDHILLVYLVCKSVTSYSVMVYTEYKEHKNWIIAAIKAAVISFPSKSRR